jgi:hypothetical protein
MQPSEQRRRRFDRVTAPDYLDGLEDRSAPDIRAMRDECREEEAQLSYIRRVLQGQLDIALVEASRRGRDGDAGSLVEDLASILSDGPSPDRREPRSVSLYEPDDPGRRLGDAERFAGRIGNVLDMADEDLTALVEDLRETERRVSDQRGVVLERLDGLQDELVRRYRDGAASIDDLVAPTTSPGGDRGSFPPHQV